MRAALLSTPLLAVAFAACSSSETVDPVSTGTTTTSTSDPPDSGPPPDGGPAKRTMTLRNPLGGPANNLLLDGDFELSSSYGTGQYGWRMFDSSGTGEIQMTVETGGLCHSGLSCVKIGKGTVLLGRGTAAAAGKGHVVELYARLGEGTPCSKISPIAILCDTFTVLKKAVPDDTFATGWCHYTASFGPSEAAVCLYVQNSLDPDQTAILDSALLGPSDGTVPLKSTPAYEPDAATLSELARVRAYVKRTTPFGLPPKPAVARP